MRCFKDLFGTWGDIMRVLLICYDFYRTAQTGAATQANETCRVLREQGHAVERIYCTVRGVDFRSENGEPLTSRQLAESFMTCDIVHLIPCAKPILRAISDMPKKPIAGSTIFWSGLERGIVGGRAKESLLWKGKCMYSAIAQMMPILHDFRGVDVFLPNTYAEGKRFVSSNCISANAICFPVTNGFNVPDFDIGKLDRPAVVGEDEYIVVPGIFAPRKNQLGLIRALKGGGHRIVFLGGKNPSTKWYYDVCRSAADDNMDFLDYIPSSAKEYWALLKYARCACLPSDCETPGIAMLEAAYAGSRPAITEFGGPREYFGFDAEYFNPCSSNSIRTAIERAWERGRLSENEAMAYARFSWEYCVSLTLQAYKLIIN